VLTIKSDHAWMLYWWAMELKPEGDERYKAKVQQSREMGEAAAAGRARVLGEEHPDRMSTLNNLAAVYRELGMFKEADAITLKDIEVSVRLLGEEHPNTITAIANMGNGLRARKRCDEAIVYLERALRSARKSLPPDAQGTAFILGWSGSCLRELGRFAEAEPKSLEARAMIVRLMGEDDRVAGAMATDLRRLYEAWDKAEPGKGYAEKAAEWAAKAPAKQE
jgi:tetratricopeptide (TPR) repeat protein